MLKTNAPGGRLLDVPERTLKDAPVVALAKQNSIDDTLGCGRVVSEVWREVVLGGKGVQVVGLLGLCGGVVGGNGSGGEWMVVAEQARGGAWYIAPYFVNGLEAYDGEVNLAFDENLISNEYVVKLCLDYAVKKEKKLDDSEKTGKSSDDWDQLLDFNFDNVPKFREELPPFVYKMGKINRNKKRAMENLNLFYQDIRPSSSAGGHLTQEEVAKEALAIRINQKYALLEVERHVIKTMAYHDKYKKILDEVWKDKVELDGKTVKEDEESLKSIKGEALKEKDDPGAFIFPIRLEGKVNENALTDTGSDINTMPYQIFETLGREDMKKIDRGITMINHT
ncbi:hypothetical protein Tco_0904197 [Tanacetum coccineum]